jgi:ssDNA-binding Zn-finger/Zn-ribbon topoisomerase 1/very-short-patch-repair endonuclease
MSDKDFALDVAKYFMDFLETNFHKRRAPKRVYKSKNTKNLLVGVNLRRFPEFQKEVLTLSSKNFNELELSIKKGKHTRKISGIILDLVSEYVKEIKEQTLIDLSNELNLKSKNLINEFKFNVDDAKNRIVELVIENICMTFIHPLVEKISIPLQSKHSFEEDFLLGMESELCGLFYEPVDSIVSEFAVSNIVKENEVDLNVLGVISIERIKSEIKSYFESLKIDDLFFELNELMNNKQIMDKQELYLYLFDIRVDKSIYPLIYIPIEVEKGTDTHVLKLDSTLYINKKAIEYAVQNINQKEGRKGKISSASNRILYLEEEESPSSVIENLFNDILNYGQIDGNFQIDRLADQLYKDKGIALSNSCYLGLFDKSDESLVNDYEELIEILSKESDILGDDFCGLLSGFLQEEPVRIVSEVEKEWDDTDASERLTTVSPIPLNDEQNQILRALNKSAKYITVEGPPGTGKSHTITAIVFNAILENKNVLVLSDKKEALDVVEDKITETLNSVRLNNDFQNPILRLGKSGNTYNKILASTSISNIKLHYKAVEKHKDVLEEQIAKIRDGLQDKIEDEIAEYSNINLPEIIEMEQLEGSLEDKDLLIVEDSELFDDETDLIGDMESLRQIGLDLSFLLGNEDADSFYGKYSNTLETFTSIQAVKDLRTILETINKINGHQIDRSSFKYIKGITHNNVSKLYSISARLEELGKGLFGYFMKGGQLTSLLNELHQNFDCPEIVNLKESRDILKNAVLIIKHFDAGTVNVSFEGFKKDKYETLYYMLDKFSEKDLSLVLDLQRDLEEVSQFKKEYPITSKNVGLDDSESIINSKIYSIQNQEFEKFTYYYRLKKKLGEGFENIPQYDYVRSKSTLEELYTTQMTHVLDGRVINFFDNHAATAKTLKNIIKSKKKFPKEEFSYLKEAFPCIIAGIRDYAEYIPLSNDLFEIVIIDEASQVSIAQALPALLRAKRIVVFGDKKQFSNIKSAQARSEINRHYIKEIKDRYTSSKKPGQSELERLSKFDIKTSVLDFFEFIGNYSIMLKKHFRGYKELISYSSKHFYSNSLQAIKIRGKSVDEVLEFKFIDHDGKLDEIENTNQLEIDEIVKLLESYTSREEPPSVGVITPHTNQQKIILENISKHPKHDEFNEKCRLKIMTFDTCQGEERDIIIYSMVAHPNSDKLNYIFIKDLKSVDVDEDNKIKAQRLNVGFSRSKEKMIFLCSKPLDEYDGSIGDALRHYYFILQKSKELPTHEDVDKNSPMEKKVLDWVQETTFFKVNMSNIELKAQFPVGDYLKQLEPTYNHPKYVCDFLLLFKDENERIHKVIIEYDGFKEHFVNLKEVNEYNYEQYYSDEDVYREKVLEGYGYKFLRINRFNVGADPVETLDKRLKSLVKLKSDKTNAGFLSNIHSIISELEQGNMKECLKCQKLLPIVDFKDSSLSTGIGRYCNMCKSTTKSRKRDRTYKAKTSKSNVSVSYDYNCPQCGAKMVKRSGRYGEFLGCTKFPRCKGTRNLPEEVKKQVELEKAELKKEDSKTNLPFNQTDAYWIQRYNECITFYKNNRKWPSGKSSNKDERSLYYWAKQQRRRYEKEGLNSEQKELMEKVNLFLASAL